MKKFLTMKKYFKNFVNLHTLLILEKLQQFKNFIAN